MIIVPDHYTSMQEAIDNANEGDTASPYSVIDILDLVTCATHYGETYP
jgi:hypothetical protein